MYSVRVKPYVDRGKLRCVEPHPDDITLANEERAQISAQDIESYLRTIRKAKRRQDENRTTRLLHLQRAEKFFADCLEIGPVETHRIKSAHLELALEAWSDLYLRGSYDMSRILDSINTILEWRGGYRNNIEGKFVYFGVSLNADIIDRINILQNYKDSSRRRELLSRQIANLTD